jgi:hypothetical protein
MSKSGIYRERRKRTLDKDQRDFQMRETSRSKVKK